jgi:membrane associated rhomboid family serine protease
MAFNSNFGNSFQRTTPVIKNLIILNALAYLVQVTLGRENPLITFMGSLHLYKSEYFRPYQLVTHMFLHDPNNIGHILFNMFGLWMFGSILERSWGPKRFLIFYLICGVGAGLISLLALNYQYEQYLHGVTALPAIYQNDIGNFLNEPMLGASGAIMGVFAAFGYLFPNTQLFIMFVPIPIKAKYAIPGLVLLDLFGGIYNASDGIAHFAHLGGALVGFLLVLYWNKKDRETFY